MMGRPAAPGIITTLCGVWCGSRRTELAEAGEIGDIGTYTALFLLLFLFCSCFTIAG